MCLTGHWCWWCPAAAMPSVSAREGDPVALQFAAVGYHTAVLDYAICEKAKDYMSPAPAGRGYWSLCGSTRPSGISCRKKLPCAAFSAGGHLALSGAVLDIPGEAAQPRPNAVILGYPVVTAGQYAHRGSFVQLAGRRRPGGTAGVRAGG